MVAEAELPPVWVVGFTGHRHLKNPVAVGAIIREQLEALRKEIPGELVGYTSVAIGGDTLFAETCQALKMPWMAALPFAATDFRSDFSESEWSHATGLLRQATDVEICGSSNDRTAAYLRCGLRTVDEADVVMAVWDREPPRGIGGTAEVVAYARAQSRPLILIHPDRLEAERESFRADAFTDPEFRFLNQLGSKLKQSPPSADGDSRKQRLELFFRKVDTVATQNAPRFRRWVAASLIMSTLAIILAAAGIGLRLKWTLLHPVIFLLLAAATLSIVYVKRRGAHRRWIRCRVAAEMCRSVLATWDLPVVATPAWFHDFEDFARLARSLRIFRLSSSTPRPSDLPAWKQHYLQTRIDNQIDYFGERSRTLHRILLILTSAFWFSSGLAISRGVFAATTGLDRLDPTFDRIVESFLPIALPLAAGCALSLISIFDLHRQLARSREMKMRLKAAGDQIEMCENFVTLQTAVEKAEKLCGEEFLEWFMLFKNPRFH
jgi:conflict system pore-forming effector with SLATT domain